MIVLRSSQGPGERRRWVEAKSGRTAAGTSGFSPHPTQSPTHPLILPRRSWAFTPLAVNQLHSLARPPGVLDSLLASPQQQSRSRILLPPFEVHIYLISLGVIGIIRQIAFLSSLLHPTGLLQSYPLDSEGRRGNPSIWRGGHPAPSTGSHGTLQICGTWDSSKPSCLLGQGRETQNKGPNKCHWAFMARGEAALLQGFYKQTLSLRALGMCLVCVMEKRDVYLGYTLRKVNK